ncbi:hypothetical protein KOW79_010419 [Hemibagrus wyckioides]|uniref:Membrane-spanning 4-domains subfamily A member 4A-like n=1 Tax=Hemibagrus wyckioides TaxID=337641 RepID=A0A9D3SPM4_9TELE|nr:hypothetical protein KOW79_010419 [Hemibagrus wyckioides]
MTPVTAPADTRLFRRTAYLKGKPKILGTVQIMIGIITLLFGIVLTLYFHTPGVISGIMLWGSLVFISSGALSVATANHQNPCMMKSSLGMNVFSAVVAGLDIILFSMDMMFGFDFIYWHSQYYYDNDDYSGFQFLWAMYYGIYGVLLVFALLEFIISICTSVFACKATSCYANKPTFSQAVTTEVMYTLQMNNPDYYFNQDP